MATHSLPSVIGVSSHSMNVGVGRIGLRTKSNQKPLDGSVLFQHKTGGPKMLKKDSQQDPCHRASSPPLIGDTNNRRVIVGFEMTQCTHSFLISFLALM